MTDAQNRKSLTIRVYGRVQGVGFRYYTHQAAVSLGVSGYVSNVPDGSVLIEAEGTPDQLSDFLDWCSKGPARAMVSDVKHFEGPLANYQSFRIR